MTFIRAGMKNIQYEKVIVVWQDINSCDSAWNSEEDLKEAFKQSRQAKIFEKDMPPVYENFEEWFEQFKKK